MKTRHSLTVSVAALASVACFTTPVSAQTMMDEWKATASSDVNMHPTYAKTVAQSAFVWAYPMINMINRRASVTSVPEPGKAFGTLPAAPKNQVGMLSNYIDPGQNFIACPNQDVVYGLGFMALDESPVVLQVPDLGDRFWVYALYDQRTDQIGELGKPYGSAPGFYMLVGPDWDGETPEGITGVLQSPTNLANVIPRIFMDDTDEDREAIQPLVDQVVVYPLADFTGEMKTIDWSEAPSFGDAASGGETNWVPPEQFLEQLAMVLEMVPPQPGEEAMYSQFEALLAVLERDEALKAQVDDALLEISATVVPGFLRWEHNGQPAGNNWNRSQNNAEWGVDYYNRASTSRSNMFDNRPNETQYFYTDYDIDGGELTGANAYEVTFAEGALPPVQGFWSMTLYNKEHFFNPNDLNRYSLGTKNKSLQYGDDGSLTLYVSNASPGEALETNWIPAPEEEFSLYIRAYWGEEGITGGEWQPPAIMVAE
ncbi:DUF1254 domain-containing protein [Tropicimonas sp. TH_r6]|uniref:DUF1254 domain-containing protein n=1 Tax=Tropicimonas sp. TH_r6 TaxID=3082085 RepID=UPI002955A730|nr:DUF1254 domain-containing protein [Tropicimonas sp. TH_r6]MDV7145946.1 DUF1254 domain-containing protein [Tropicimonas sp. TH_r6]